MQRYQRQVLLSQIGERGQAVISNSRVLIVGAGGLGHPAASYLSAMGVGHIGIVDGDRVQESNLHRQVLFADSDLGKNKAICVAEKLAQRGDPIEIQPIAKFLDKEIALATFPNYDVILDCTDNFTAKHLINDMACLFRKPVVYGSISQFEGQVSVFWRGHGPCYRCLVPDHPKAKIQNCADSGVIGALPGAIGSIQAIEALKVLVKIGDQNTSLKPMLGRLQIFDFAINDTRTLGLRVRQGCLCQNDNLTLEMVAETTGPVCEASSGASLIDVRESDEWHDFHINGTLHWPLSKIDEGKLPLHLIDQPMVLICKSGVRAEKAYHVLKGYGFKKCTFTKESIYGYQVKRD